MFLVIFLYFSFLKFRLFWIQITDPLCSNGELNTSKAKLRGANYPREKSKDQAVLLSELQSCERAKLLLTEMHTPYIVCVCEHTAVVGRTTVT